MSTATALLGLLQASLRTRQRLVVENLTLCHQLVVLKRSIKRPRIEDCDRIFWILLRRTFLANHMDTTIACDLFTVPTVTFRNLFVFVVLHHGSRRILHVGVTVSVTMVPSCLTVASTSPVGSSVSEVDWTFSSHL